MLRSNERMENDRRVSKAEEMILSKNNRASYTQGKQDVEVLRQLEVIIQNGNVGIRVVKRFYLCLSRGMITF